MDMTSLSFLMVYLLQKRILSARMEPLQLLTLTLKFIADGGLLGHPLVITDETSSEENEWGYANVHKIVMVRHRLLTLDPGHLE